MYMLCCFFASRIAIILFLYLYMYFYHLAVNKSCSNALDDNDGTTLNLTKITFIFSFQQDVRPPALGHTYVYTMRVRPPSLCNVPHNILHQHDSICFNRYLRLTGLLTYLKQRDLKNVSRNISREIFRVKKISRN